MEKNYCVISRDEYAQKVYEEKYNDYAKAYAYYLSTAAEIGCGGCGSIEVVSRDCCGNIDKVYNYREFNYSRR